MTPGLGRSTGRAMTAVLFAALAVSYATPAQAGRILIVTQPPGGGITPKGDPTYTFTIDVALNPGFVLNLGDSITLENVPGVNTTSFYSTPNVPGPGLPAGDGWLTNPLVTSTTGTWPGADGETPIDVSDVKWTLAGVAPIDNSAGGSPLALGAFSIDTYQPFSLLPLGYHIDLNYILTLANGTVADSGMVTLTRGPAVPEPASLALLGLGVALPVAVAARRRRRAAA